MISLERKFLHVFLIWLTFRCFSCLPDEITVGGLFGEDEDQRVQNAFKYAVYWINHKRAISKNTKLQFENRILQTKDLFKSTKDVCTQIGHSSAAIFGPNSQELASFVNSVCRYLHIPHLEYQEESTLSTTSSFSINLHPSASELAKAYLEVIKYYNMQNILVIYGSTAGLAKMQHVIREVSQQFGNTIHIRFGTDDNMRELLMEAKRKEWTNIVADLSPAQTSILLKMALQQGMINPYYHYLVTTLDIDTLDLDDFKYNHVNITGFRLVDPSNQFVRAITDDMYFYQMNTRLPLLMGNHNTIPYQSALLFDAVLLFARALEELDNTFTLRPINVSCDWDDPWKSGLNLYNYLNTVHIKGLTGDVSLQNGRRLLFNIDVVQLRKDGLKKTGTWNLERGLNITSKQEYVLLGNKTLIVSTNINRPLTVVVNIEAPYVMLKENPKHSSKTLKGNDRFEGFCIDLLKAIAKYVEFEYEIKEVEDKMYGVLDEKTGEWNGIIKELIERKADMSMAGLTINYEREQYVDFTKPFLNLGISILFKKPKREKPGLFSFLNPLATEIWIYLIAAYLTVSFSIFVLARFSPYEWYNPHPCIPDTDSVENTFNLSNSMWFAIGTLMQQGSDINPRAVSTRIVGSAWWFFTLIIISSYTANLAAFLTIERLVSPIESAEDLAKQTEIEYGLRRGGTTQTFFERSTFQVYQQMWNFMKSHESTVLTNSASDGIERVRNGGYAFFMESTSIDYITKQDCSLMQIGGLLDTKGFGIATPSGSPLRDKLSMAVLHFQEDGYIQELYERWWRGSGNCEAADAAPAAGKANPLGVYNVGGIFVVLIGGLVISVFVGLLEFIIKSRQNAREDRESICSEMAKELRFAVKCHGSSKKINKSVCSKCNVRHARSTSCALKDSTDTMRNGGIRLQDMRKSPYHSRKDLNNRYKDSGYLHVDYSDTDHETV